MSRGGTPIDVFVIHDGDDKELCLYLAGKLNRAFDDRLIFWSSWDLDKGQTWSEAIRRRLTRSAAVVVILNPFSLDKRWVNTELGAAWALGKPVFPLLHLGAKGSALTGPVANHQVTDLTDEMEVVNLISRIAEQCGINWYDASIARPLCSKVRSIDRRQVQPFQSIAEINQDLGIRSEFIELEIRRMDRSSKSRKIFIEDHDLVTVRITADAYPETHVVFSSREEMHNPKYFIVHVISWDDLESREKLKFFGVDVHGEALYATSSRRRRVRNRDHDIYVNCGKGLFVFEVPGYLYRDDWTGKFDFALNFWMIRFQGLILRFLISSEGYDMSCSSSSGITRSSSSSR